jgi:hypothetical protein
MSTPPPITSAAEAPRDKLQQRERTLAHVPSFVKNETLPMPPKADKRFGTPLGVCGQKFGKCPSFTMGRGAFEAIPIIEQKYSSMLEQAAHKTEYWHRGFVEIAIHQNNGCRSHAELILEVLAKRGIEETLNKIGPRPVNAITVEMRFDDGPGTRIIALLKLLCFSVTSLYGRQSLEGIESEKSHCVQV